MSGLCYELNASERKLYTIFYFLLQSLNNAHKGWVSGMAISGDVLLSSCRGGIIRLWNVKTCDNLAEMKTDSSINDIVTSGQRVFTASR